jgi:hypothetical protein
MRAFWKKSDVKRRGWKTYKQRESFWIRLIIAKYMIDGDFFRSRDQNGHSSGKVYTT